MEWFDDTSYSRSDKVREPRIWRINLTRTMSLTVFRHISFGKEWFSTCERIGLNMTDLNTENVTVAKERALLLARKRLNELSAEYRNVAVLIKEMMEETENEWHTEKSGG